MSNDYGADSKKAIEAWDFVDELEAEVCFYGAPKPEKTARQLFSNGRNPVSVG